MPTRELIGIFVVSALFAIGLNVTAVIVQKKSSSTGSKYAELSFKKVHNHSTDGYFAVISNPRQHFHIYYPEENGNPRSCAGRAYTSTTAELHNCNYATNAGPFNYSNPTCLNNIISDGRQVQIVDNDQITNFGLTKGGYFAMGEMSAKKIKELDFDQLVSGFGWLVRDYAIIPTSGGEVAPRTAIGVDPLGRLLLIEIDGVEDDTPPKGLTLRQLAGWFAALGVQHAINLDGGGSSVTVHNNKVISQPSCHDVPVVCQRAVTTITCITGEQ